MTDFNVLVANQVSAKNVLLTARTARKTTETAWYAATVAVGIPQRPVSGPNPPVVPATLPVDLNALGAAFAAAVAAEKVASDAYEAARKAHADAMTDA